MALDTLEFRAIVAPWVKVALQFLHDTAPYTVPLIGANSLVKFAEWIVRKGTRIEIVSKTL